MPTKKTAKVSKKKTFTQVCECKNCGNEAEMVVTCSLPEQTAVKIATDAKKAAHTHQGTARCTRCGNEADIWLEEA